MQPKISSFHTLRDDLKEKARALLLEANLDNTKKQAFLNEISCNEPGVVFEKLGGLFFHSANGTPPNLMRTIDGAGVFLMLNTKAESVSFVAPQYTKL